MKRSCLLCGAAVKGRADKKFCDYTCRNEWNNMRRYAEEKQIRRIVTILRKNRTILLAHCPDKTARVPKYQLDASGFDYRYTTHQFQTYTGKIYYASFDMAFTPFNDKNRHFAHVVKVHPFVDAWQPLRW